MAIDINRGSTNVILDPEVSGEIISKAIEESAFMQLAPRITIAGNGKKYQTITGDPEPEWRGETDPAAVGKFTYGSKTVEPYSMDLIVPFSNEFKRDKKGLYDECVRRIPKLFGRKLDKTVMSDAAPGENFDVLGGASAVSMTPATGKTLYDTFIAVDETISGAGGIMSAIAFAPQGRSFWSSDILTGSQTAFRSFTNSSQFWSSDILTGSQTRLIKRAIRTQFWSSDILTGSQTVKACNR